MNAPAPNTAPGAVTAQHDFFNATHDGDKLFSVRGGVPLSEAFEQLTLLLSASQSCMEGEDMPAQWAGVHLMDFSLALVQSMHHGLIEHERAPVQPPLPAPLHVVP